MKSKTFIWVGAAYQGFELQRENMADKLWQEVPFHSEDIGKHPNLIVTEGDAAIFECGSACNVEATLHLDGSISVYGAFSWVDYMLVSGAVYKLVYAIDFIRDQQELIRASNVFNPSV